MLYRLNRLSVGVLFLLLLLFGLAFVLFRFSFHIISQASCRDPQAKKLYFYISVVILATYFCILLRGIEQRGKQYIFIVFTYVYYAKIAISTEFKIHYKLAMLTEY